MVNFTYTNSEKEVVELDVEYTILPVKIRGKYQYMLLEVVAYDQEKEDLWPVLDFDVRYAIEEQCFFDHNNK